MCWYPHESMLLFVFRVYLCAFLKKNFDLFNELISRFMSLYTVVVVCNISLQQKVLYSGFLILMSFLCQFGCPQGKCAAFLQILRFSLKGKVHRLGVPVCWICH